jgi:hypothetical protein
MRVRVDFNAETPEGTFRALLSRLDGMVSPGDLVEAYDADGDRMVVAVDEIDEGHGLVYLSPDWSTWVDGETPAEGLRLVRIPSLHLGHNIVASPPVADSDVEPFTGSLVAAGTH